MSIFLPYIFLLLASTLRKSITLSATAFGADCRISVSRSRHLDGEDVNPIEFK
jgi:hypothetical protein